MHVSPSQQAIASSRGYSSGITSPTILWSCLDRPDLQWFHAGFSHFTMLRKQHAAGKTILRIFLFGSSPRLWSAARSGAWMTHMPTTTLYLSPSFSLSVQNSMTSMSYPMLCYQIGFVLDDLAQLVGYCKKCSEHVQSKARLSNRIGLVKYTKWIFSSWYFQFMMCTDNAANLEEELGPRLWVLRSFEGPSSYQAVADLYGLVSRQQVAKKKKKSQKNLYCFFFGRGGMVRGIKYL